MTLTTVMPILHNSEDANAIMDRRSIRPLGPIVRVLTKNLEEQKVCC